MRFTPQIKSQIIDAAKMVYYGYYALFLANNEGSPTLAQQISEALKSQKESFILHIHGQRLICFIQHTKRYGFIIRFNTQYSDERPGIKPLKEYSQADKLMLLEQHQFTADIDPKTGQLVMGALLATTDESTKIGGLGKKDLYPEHIANLGLMIQELETNPNPQTMLAAMATGSGKSFTQALWFLVLSISRYGRGAGNGINAIFSAPSALCVQLHQLMCEFLPTNEANQIILVPDSEDPEETYAKLMSLHLNNEAFFAIISHGNLLDNHWQLLESLPKESTFIAFDEQDKVMQREDRAIKLPVIAKQFPSMFLTATPNAASYELCGNKAVLTLSTKQKVAQGHVLPTQYKHITNQDVNQRVAQVRKTYPSYKAYAIAKLNEKLVGVFNPPGTSAAEAMIREIQYRVSIKESDFPGKRYDPTDDKLTPYEKARKLLRWNVTLPAAEKMLVITHDTDTMINVNESIGDDLEDFIYQNGDYVTSSATKLNERLNEVARTSLTLELENYIKRMLPDEEIECSDLIAKFTHPKVYVFSKLVIIHNIINNALSYITGLDFITLDLMRFDDLEGLTKRILDIINNKRYDEIDIYYHYVDKENLDLSTAMQLAKNIYKIIKFLQLEHLTFYRKMNFIDNWTLEALDHANIMDVNQFTFSFKSSSTYFSCTNLENNDLEFENRKVYAGLERKNIPMHVNGRLNPAIKHPPDSGIRDAMMSGFRPNRLITIFEPQETKMSETQMDSAFRLGLIPYLIGNTKSTGFNDRNLQVSVNLVSKTHDPSNNPAIGVQSNRTRGENPTKHPVHIQVDDVGVTNLFPLQSLEKDDYIPDLLKGLHLFENAVFSQQGKIITKKLRQWIRDNLNADGSVDAESLKKVFFGFLIECLENINHTNGHDIEKTRLQFATTLKSLQQEVHFENIKLQNLYHVSIFFKVLVALVNAILTKCNLYYHYKFKKAVKKIDVELSKSDNAEKTSQIKLYKKIISQNLTSQRTRSQMSLTFFGFFAGNAMALITMMQNGGAMNSPAFLLKKRQMLNVIQKPDFKVLLKYLIKHYSQEELLLIAKPAIPAAQGNLVAFINLLNPNWVETGINEFATVLNRINDNAYARPETNLNDFIQLSASVFLVQLLYTQMTSTHTYFNGLNDQADFKKEDVQPPAFLTDPTLQTITLDYQQDLTAYVTLAKSTINGLSITNELHADENKHQRNILKEVNKNLITPMRAGLSGSAHSSTSTMASSARLFATELNKVKPLTLEEAVANKHSCLEPLRQQFVI